MKEIYCFNNCSHGYKYLHLVARLLNLNSKRIQNPKVKINGKLFFSLSVKLYTEITLTRTNHPKQTFQRALISVWAKISYIGISKADTQKDKFCPGTGIWIWKCPDNLFGQICKIEVYNGKYYGVSGKSVVKLAFISNCFSQNHATLSSLFI